MRIDRAAAVAAALVWATGAVAQQSQPAPPPAAPYGSPISLDQAIKAATAAMAKAGDIQVPNAVAVVEPSGDLVYFAKMSGAPYSAVQLAQQKAVASARYRRPTKAFYDGIEGGHPFFLTFPGVAGAPGGAPLIVDGKLIGAIGVSGGNGDQGMAVAGAGVEALK